MGLTWDEFLILITLIENLALLMYNFNDDEIGMKEKNRIVATAAINYKEFFNDLKYIQFMNEVRISLEKIY